MSDFLTASVVWLAFNVFRYQKLAVHHGYSSLGSYLQSPVVSEGQILVPLMWLVLYYFSGYYNRPYGKSRLGELFLTFVSVTIGVVVIFLALVLNDLPVVSQTYYQFFFFLYGLQFGLTYLVRLLITQDCLRKIKSGYYALNVLILGCGRKAEQMAGEMLKQGYAITGFVEMGEKADVCVSQERIVGTWQELPDCFRRYPVDELVVALEDEDASRLIRRLYALYHYKIPVKVLLGHSNPLARGQLKTIYGSPLIDVTDCNMTDAGRNIKWAADKILSALALLLLAPLFGYIAWRVKRDSPGPVFFSQERIGYRGTPFRIYKFRTMYVDAEDSGPMLSREGDTRITPFGVVMRKYRLDELPQFWNVLKGDMSLVGPRPERRYFIDRIVERAPYYYLLHNVRPGITSLGMVKYGYAGNVDEMVERLKFDILYYENMSLALDITILVYTIKTVFTGKGV